MKIKSFIINRIKKKGFIKASEVVKKSGFSRAYVNRFFQELRDEGKIILLGKANQTRYVLADKKSISREKAKILRIKKILVNDNLSEDIVLNDIKNSSGIFVGIRKNIVDIIDYAFTEMLNNAIEHSRSKKIEVVMQRSDDQIRFIVTDWGIGVFNNIMKKAKLKSNLEAIHELLKGKQTTAPDKHSGEGIFFTSKVADLLLIQSEKKQLMFHNILDDIFIRDISLRKGTKVSFLILLRSNKQIRQIFNQYTEGGYSFTKTKLAIKLYAVGSEYISRSQARRLLTGLDKFTIIVLDFDGVATIGQAFADEVYRVWQAKHPQIEINNVNINDNIEFMINRAKG